MSDIGFPSQRSQFRHTLKDCRDLYVSSGKLCALEYPHLISRSGDAFVQLMDDLHRALVLKVYFAVCEADRRWSKDERLLAEVLFHHLWDRWLKGEQLKMTARKASQESTQLQWYSLVRPFDRIAPLRERVGELETLVVRLANLVARADGRLHPQEADAIRSLQDELHHHLRAVPIDSADQHREADTQGSQAIEQLRREADGIHRATHSDPQAAPGQAVQTETAAQQPSAEETSPEISLEEALAELDNLIGLERVKHEVRTLTNFLKMQQRRSELGLPQTEVSLHMVFNGNPGTGKTTVARVVGKVFSAMGILSKGHLVETDRSGLVAEYAGQTGPKANAKIDEALDGVLFIDEAYSLIADGEDPFGREAVQALLKRVEDDRQRLVVVLAGYPDEMSALLRSNPGLSSRFSRQLKFDDFSPLELARIFGLMCDKNHYQLTSAARLELLLGTTWWYDHRDHHFGNGRAIRNLFEHSIRLLANRLANIAELSAEKLSLLEADDIEFAKVPREAFTFDPQSPPRVHIGCPACEFAKDVSPKYLGQNVKCPKCGAAFVAEWGGLVVPGT